MVVVNHMGKRDSPPLAPFKPPLIDTDDEINEWDWYYSEKGGGMRLDFPKYKGRRMNEVPLSYLAFCRVNSRLESFRSAYDIYYNGLRELAETGDDYKSFIVPFGEKHRGKTIRECRDKEWFEWTKTRPNLTSEHELYFVAVQRWLDNPRRQNLKRDIGELLLVSKYADDLDLSKKDQSTEEDEEFIASSEDDDDTSGIEISDDEVVGENDQDEADQDEADQDETSQSSDSDGDNSSDMVTTPPRSRKEHKSPEYKRQSVPRTPTRLKRKTHSDDSDKYIIRDEMSDGSKSYENSSSDTDSVIQTPRRITRALRATLDSPDKETVSSALNSPSVTRYRYSNNPVVRSPDESEDSEDDIPIPYLKRSSVSVKGSGTLKGKNKQMKEGQTTDESDDAIMPNMATKAIVNELFPTSPALRKLKGDVDDECPGTQTVELKRRRKLNCRLELPVPQLSADGGL